MQKNTTNSALGRANYAVIAIAVILIIAGLCLMCGSGTTEAAFEPDIFSARRIRLAPALCLCGYVLVLVGILIRPD